MGSLDSNRALRLFSPDIIHQRKEGGREGGGGGGKGFEFFFSFLFLFLLLFFKKKKISL